MELYRHTQPGHAIRVSMLLGVTLMAALCFALGAPVLIVFAIVGATLLACLALFYSLTVTVTSNELALSFGPGLIRRSWRLADIAEWKTVRNPWYYGWGIHLTPQGWLYNVSGFDAVEIKLRDGKSYRIGADAPEQLAEAISRSKQS